MASVSKYAIELIEDIYREGDVDIVFFGELLGYVSAKQLGGGEAIPYDKSPAQSVADAIELATFLISSCDFYVRRGHRAADGTFSYRHFDNGLAEFRDLIWRQFADGGIDGVDLIWTTSLVKLLPGKRSPPAIPEMISAIVSR